MEPVLRAGDRVTVEGIEPQRLRHGDIVVFESPLAGLVVHRVLWMVPPFGEPSALYTKGDASPYLDRPLPARQVLGRVVEIERGDGRRKVGRIAGIARWVAAGSAWMFTLGLRRMGRKALTHREIR